MIVTNKIHLIYELLVDVMLTSGYTKKLIRNSYEKR